MKVVDKIMGLHPGMAENELIEKFCPGDFSLVEYHPEDGDCVAEACEDCWNQEYKD